MTLPPLHPRCRCAIMYREATRIDSLSAIGNTGSAQANLLNAIPKGVGLYRTFDELKLYWAENYNVKVSASVAALNFEAVRAALSGVEAVLTEFMPACFFMKEFNTLPIALMSTRRGQGAIYFNPEIFSDVSKLTAIISAGVASDYYPKNMTVAGVGAHEAGHIVEDWLRGKQIEATDFSFRVLPRKLIREAYQKATLNTVGKSIEQMKAEISIHALKENLSECLADAICDYVINGTQAALLSQELWRILKKGITKMHAFNETRLAEYTQEELLTYGLFDDLGCLVGVKENAPVEFKLAYEADKQKAKEWETLGID